MEQRLIGWPWPIEYTSDWDGPFDWTVFATRGYGEVTLFPWKIESENEWWARSLKLGEIACALAHDACWHRAAELSGSYFLVLEDDVTWARPLDRDIIALTEQLKAFEWDLCYLGRVPLGPGKPVSEGLVRPGYSHCTYAYLMSGVGAERLAEAHIKGRMMPVDEFLPALYGEHPRPDVSAAVRPTIRAFAVEPDLVQQVRKDIAGSDTEDSPFVSDE